MVLSGECAAWPDRPIWSIWLIDSAVAMLATALRIFGWFHIPQLNAPSFCHCLVLLFAVGLRSCAELKFALGPHCGSHPATSPPIERNRNYRPVFPLTCLIALTNPLK